MILLLENVDQLNDFISRHKKIKNRIGFVPTMGAIHRGHIKLAKRCKEENDISIVSIFVNPTQFNNKADLDKYPRNLEDDISKLMSTRISAVFAPSEYDIYPRGLKDDNKVNLGGLDEYMEGAFRPGHFAGVAQVVKRLLDLVQPDNLYMGQKDFQQSTIIQYMINSLNIPTNLVVCPIIREVGGLAMSSRNERLSPDTRKDAALIYKTLKTIDLNKNKKSIADLVAYGMRKLSQYEFKPEYVSIVDGNTLMPVDNINDSDYVVVCIAVWADGVRLIDNLILKQR